MTGRASAICLAAFTGGRRARPLLGLAVLLPLLFGCASVRPTALTTQQSAASFKARSFDDAGLKRFAASAAAGIPAWPPAQYDARALDVAALYFSPAVAVAHAKWQAADAAIGTAGQIPNPTLSLAPQYVSNAEAGIPAWVLATSLVQVIETAGKRPFRVTRARYLAQAARFDALNAAWDVVGAVNGALIDVAVAERRGEALAAQVNALSALADAADQRLKVGLGSSLESATARTALNKAVIDREISQAAGTDARQKLAAAIGVPADALPPSGLRAALPETVPSSAFRRTLQEDAILNRADLMARLANYAASDTALQLEAARQYPDIELGPGYEYDQGAHKWGVSLNVALPVFNQNQGPIGEARAARQQAADEFLQTQAAVIGDVDRTLAAYDAALRTQGVARDLLRRQTRQLQGQQALFDRGEIDRVALLEAKVEMANAQLAAADAQGALARALLGLEQAGQHSLSGFDPTSLLEPAGRE